YQKALRKRQVWVEPLFAESKEWHGMRRFRLRRLWRVNCEALVTAAGHNLQQLLKKRGWGRHPFPTEAVASVPPNFEPDEVGVHDFLNSRRSSVAVASLVTGRVLSMVVEPQTRLFSLAESYSISLLASLVFSIIYRIFIVYSD